MGEYILASQSPRRKQLLQWAEIDFEIIVADTDENFPEGLEPQEASIYIARQKALAIKHKTGTAKTIIAADTIVVLNNEIIGKPKNREDAIKILSKLNGQLHHVITGVSIIADKEINFFDVSEVTFHALSLSDIIYYIDKYEPYDKAGAYAIQEWIGVVGIKSVNGDFYNVMGLPVSRVVQALKSLKT